MAWQALAVAIRAPRCRQLKHIPHRSAEAACGWGGKQGGAVQEGATQEGAQAAPSGADRATHERQRLLPSLDAAASRDEPASAQAAAGLSDLPSQIAEPDLDGSAADAAGLDAPSMADLPSADDAAPPEEPVQPGAATLSTAAVDLGGECAVSDEPLADAAPAAGRPAAAAEPAGLPALSPLQAAAGIVTPATNAPATHAPAPAAAPKGEAPASHVPAPAAAPQAAQTPGAAPVSTGPAKARAQAVGAGAPASEPVGDPGSGGVASARSGGGRSAGKENAQLNSGAASDKRKSAGKSGHAWLLVLLKASERGSVRVLCTSALHMMELLVSPASVHWQGLCWRQHEAGRCIELRTAPSDILVHHSCDRPSTGKRQRKGTPASPAAGAPACIHTKQLCVMVTCLRVFDHTHHKATRRH